MHTSMMTIIMMVMVVEKRNADDNANTDVTI
jgi:hypothetical protein